MKRRVPRLRTSTPAPATTSIVTPVVRAVAPRRGVRGSCRAGSPTVSRVERPARPDASFRYYVDANGRQHFNFVQQIWLRAQVEMAMTSVPTLALETLAVNLLTLATRERDCVALVGVTSRRALQSAQRFCAEILLSAGASGWVMPRAVVRTWLATRSRD